jgi:hypothetical protein
MVSFLACLPGTVKEELVSLWRPPGAISQESTALYSRLAFLTPAVPSNICMAPTAHLLVQHPNGLRWCKLCRSC